MKDKLLITSDIIVVLLIGLVIIMDIVIGSKPVEKDINVKVKKEVSIKENTPTEIEEVLETENTIIEEKKEEIVEDNKVVNNNNNISSNNSTQINNKPVNNTPVNNTPTTPVQEQPKEPTYSCPEGYNLNGTICTQTIDANYECPENTHDFSDGIIPSNTYCINLSEGNPTEEETCPEGYGRVKQISLGGPSTYNCFPLHKKEYKCNDGYNLNGDKCSKTINANVN